MLTPLLHSISLSDDEFTSFSFQDDTLIMRHVSRHLDAIPLLICQYSPLNVFLVETLVPLDSFWQWILDFKTVEAIACEVLEVPVTFVRAGDKHLLSFDSNDELFMRRLIHSLTFDVQWPGKTTFRFIVMDKSALRVCRRLVKEISSKFLITSVECSLKK